SNTNLGAGRSKAEPPSQPRRVCKPKPELAETAEANQPRVCKSKLSRRRASSRVGRVDQADPRSRAPCLQPNSPCRVDL
uniref:Uncharacterized protein n=1 Tax=Cucumis melo TaxID=3656 RepID=A0A9I9E3Q2_CUCME